MVESLSWSSAVQPLVSHLMDEDIRGFPFFNLTSACEKNKLRAKKKLPALCLPCDKVLSLCTAPEISFFFLEGLVPTPVITSPGSIRS